MKLREANQRRINEHAAELTHLGGPNVLRRLVCRTFNEDVEHGRWKDVARSLRLAATDRAGKLTMYAN